MASVKLINYRQWLNNCLDNANEEIRIYERCVEDRRKEYESNWFRKLFRLKFKDSSEWHWSWYCPYYGIVSRTKNEITKVDYHLALFDKRIEFNTKDFSESNFYRYCKDNKLP